MEIKRFSHRELEAGVMFNKIKYVGNVEIKESLCSLDPEDTKAMLQECMYRMDKAQKAFTSGQDEINVEYDEDNNESKTQLMRKYISDEIVISMTPVRLELKLDIVRIMDDQGGQLVQNMPSISFIGDDNVRYMFSYVVKEPAEDMNDNTTNSSNNNNNNGQPILKRRCYVFQADCREELKKAGLPEDEIPDCLNKQIKTIFTAFQDAFQCYRNSISFKKDQQQQNGNNNNFSNIPSQIPLGQSVNGAPGGFQNNVNNSSLKNGQLPPQNTNNVNNNNNNPNTTQNQLDLYEDLTFATKINNQSFFHQSISRQQAISYLTKPGDFLLRLPSGKPGKVCLSVLDDSNIPHHLILDQSEIGVVRSNYDNGMAFPMKGIGSQILRNPIFEVR